MSFDVSMNSVPTLRPVYSQVRCCRCEVALPPVFEEQDHLYLQPADALIVSLRGGYGMFIDPDVSRSSSTALDPRFDRVLCHECAHELCEFLGLDLSDEHACDMPVDDSSSLPFTPVTPSDALAEVLAVLGPAGWDDVGRCRACSGAEADVRREIEAAADPVAALRAVCAVLAAGAHVGSAEFHRSLVKEDSWCDFDLLMVRDTALLGLAGVPYLLVWGPPHAAGVEHPASALQCAPCQAWIASRAQARAMCESAGIDASVCLGDSDEPVRPRPGR